MSVAPWKAEMQTMLSLWSNLLPFGIQAPAQALVTPSAIAEYKITFPEFTDDELRTPHFMLPFWNTAMGQAPLWLKYHLQDDEHAGDFGKGSDQVQVPTIREQGVRLFTTFKFAAETRMASFWCRKDIVEERMADDWLGGRECSKED